MAWTAPRTWVTLELVTAAIMNTHVRNNLLYLKGEAGPVEVEGVSFLIDTDTLADDGTYNITDATTGIGFVIFGDHAEWGMFTWMSDGTVTIELAKDANLVTTDTDTKYCIYDSGTQVVIKNRSGAPSVMVLWCFYV